MTVVYPREMLTTGVKCHLKLTPYCHLKIPKIHPPFHLSSGSIPEAPALIAGLKNFAVMR